LAVLPQVQEPVQVLLVAWPTAQIYQHYLQIAALPVLVALNPFDHM
jgi:hypothetical protein